MGARRERGLLFVLVAVLGCGPGSSSGDDAGRADAETPDADAAPVECSELPSASTVAPGLDELTVLSDPGSPQGIFDPSTFYPPGSSAGVLVYSSVDASDAVHTRVATSSDSGATWTYASTINEATETVLQCRESSCSGCASGSCAGNLVHEVPSIVHDPTDEAARAFKVFTHSYIALPGASAARPDLRREYGYISLWTSASVTGPWTHEPLLGWQSESDLSSTGVTQVLTGLDGLSECLAFTEPSAVVLPGAIYLALGCAYFEDEIKVRIELLRSTDHARSFSRVARVMGPEDTQCLGDFTPIVNAPELFVVSDVLYLSVSPEGPVTGGFSGYRGCLVYAFDDPGTGHLRRDADGYPEIVRYLSTTDGRFHGACDYADGVVANGYLVSTLFLDGPPRIFRILRSPFREE